MRFYETSEGDIRYGKTNVGEISTAALRSSISYVTQETFLFEDTIENNIKVAKEDASREEVVAAAKKRHCMNLSCHCRMAMTRS